MYIYVWTNDEDNIVTRVSILLLRKLYTDFYRINRRVERLTGGKGVVIPANLDIKVGLGA